MKKRRASNLIEVVIATGLIVIIGTISILLIGIGLSSLKRAKALHNATSLAQQKMEEGIFTAPKKLGTLSGTFPAPYQDYTYSVRYEPNSKYEALQNMFLNVNGPFATNIAYAASLPAPSTKIVSAVICDIYNDNIQCQNSLLHFSAIADGMDIYVRVKGYGFAATYNDGLGTLGNFRFTVAKTGVKGLTATTNHQVSTSSFNLPPIQVHLSFRDLDGTQEQLCNIDLTFRNTNQGASVTPEARVYLPKQGGGWDFLSWSSSQTQNLTTSYSEYCQTITP